MSGWHKPAPVVSKRMLLMIYVKIQRYIIIHDKKGVLGYFVLQII